MGAVGLHHLDSAHGHAEPGYWVGVPYWNRGFATEAAGAVLGFAFGGLKLHRVAARYFPRNPASGQVMRKLGMRHEGTLREHVWRWDRFEDLACYAILEHEWRGLGPAVGAVDRRGQVASAWMCTLIYATVPARTDLAKLPATSVHLSAVVDPVVEPKLDAGEQLCWADGVPRCAAGGFCGTVLGREARSSGRDSEERDAAQARKLRKKGWSEHKVQAWLAQKQGARRSTQPHLNGTVDELALWTELVRVAIEEARLHHLGLMVFTAGDEPGLPRRTESVSRSECDLTRLEAGVLYRIHG